MPPPRNNGRTGRVPRGWATKTASQVAQEQEAHEAKLRGEATMRAAMSRPMSLFKLTRSVTVSSGKLGLYQVLVAAQGSPDSVPPPQRAGAILMFVSRDRVQVGQVSTPVYTFMMMGQAARVVVQDLSLIVPA